ncbi:(2Fe-2S) ferredoxin domain-containing protein [Oscillatoria sp. FACHB-1407]|uniref:(2Fe-2S) ferredoxin domain-containing protein n=1 Tax=Oscillatoria sp. FACHB-1407 TaxID=2692847 RepID=UPI00168422B0|nr:(2Fe-2S) ferredoxin domain-containing protein [Oscillatoria sp. FACHB-1407]MBD2460573.1 (2Fe-2S) ferredoxin domain-containing protein [Oscillatoria sp. FACHB-1407]
MRTVLICQSKACRKGGSAKVLAAFQNAPVADVEVIASGCLGQCGSGPMVLILPDEIWYNRVSPKEVSAVVDRHLHHGVPVKAMLYPKFHG